MTKKENKNIVKRRIRSKEKKSLKNDNDYSTAPMVGSMCRKGYGIGLVK